MNRSQRILLLSLLGLPLYGQNVGIGTSTPAAKLHVYNPSGTAAPLAGYFQNLNNAAGNNGVLIEIARDQTDVYALNVQSGTTSRLYVRGDGRIGVGTTATVGTVHILQERPGTDFPRGIILDHFSNDPWAGQINQRKARGTISAPLSVLKDDVLAAWHGGGFDGSQFTASRVCMRMRAAEDWNSNANGTYITLETTLKGTPWVVERVRIDDAGNVGIGTTAPSAKLDVVGSIVWGSSSVSYASAPSGEAITGRGPTSIYRIALQDGSGRVNHYWNSYYDGATSQHKYVAAGEQASRLLMGWDGGANNNAFRFQVAPAATNAGDPITWTDVLAVNYNGNVGIGVINPTERLEVNGNVRADAFIANKYPRVVANLDITGPNVTVPGVPWGWTPVRATTSSTYMEASVTVDAPTDLYLVTYTYRVQSPTGSYKWSGLHILNGGTSVRFTHLDGSNLNRTDYGASGAVFVTGLPAGTYTFRLEDWSSVTENRSFVFERQLLIYRLR